MLPNHLRSVHTSQDPIHTQADRFVREALCRWTCSHVESAFEANRALAAYETGSVQDFGDDLGAETFTVLDREAPDGAYLCGRDWCACDPMKELSIICYHSLAVCLLLGYRNHYARLAAARPLRKFALVVKPADPRTIRESSRLLTERLAACREALMAGGAE